MRPATHFSLHAALATVLIAFAATGSAAADAFLKLGDIKGEASGSARVGHEVVVQVESWSWGATNAGTAKVSMQDLQVASGAAIPDPNSPRLAVSDPGAPGPKTTSKRQHGSVTISKPLDRGSVTVKGNLPGCTVGAAYADAVLQTASMRYELKEVMVSSCTVSGSGGGGGVPTESVTLNYDSYRESPTRPSQK